MDKKEFSNLINDFNGLVNNPLMEIPSVGLTKANINGDFRVLVNPSITNPTENELVSIIYLSDMLGVIDETNDNIPENLIFSDNVCKDITAKYRDAFNVYDTVDDGDREMIDDTISSHPTLFLRLDNSIFTEDIDESYLRYSVEDFISSKLPTELEELDDDISKMLDNQIEELKNGNVDINDYSSSCDCIIQAIDQACEKLLDKSIEEVHRFILERINYLIPKIEYDYRIDALAEINHAKYILENAVREFILDVENCNRNLIRYRLGNIKMLVKHLR